MKVQGVVEAKRKDGAGILVNGEWYSSYKGKGLADVEKGSSVSFDFEYSKDGKYKNINGDSVRVTGQVSKGGSAPTAKAYSSVGVELGHASKLAMDMALGFFEQTKIGTDEFYVFWREQTVKIYKAMGKLRDQAENAKAEKKPAPVEEAVQDDDEEDVGSIF